MAAELVVLHRARREPRLQDFIDLDTVRCSVPYRLVRERVEVRATAVDVRVFHAGALVALHARCFELHARARRRPGPPPRPVATHRGPARGSAVSTSTFSGCASNTSGERLDAALAEAARKEPTHLEFLGGHSVLFVTAAALLGALARAETDGQLADNLACFAKPAARHRRARISPARAARATCSSSSSQRRYERSSTFVITNQLVTQWDTVFGDEVLAAAILDRLLHYSHPDPGRQLPVQAEAKAGLVPKAK